VYAFEVSLIKAAPFTLQFHPAKSPFPPSELLEMHSGVIFETLRLKKKKKNQITNTSCNHMMKVNGSMKIFW